MSEVMREEAASPLPTCEVPQGRWGWVQFGLSCGIAGTTCLVLRAMKKQNVRLPCPTPSLPGHPSCSPCLGT